MRFLVKGIVGLLLIIDFSGCKPAPEKVFYKGVNLTSWQKGELSSNAAKLSLDQLEKTNIDTIMVVPTWYVKEIESNEVFAHQSKSSTDSDLRTILSDARERGYKIVIKPHVDVLTGEWRGYIKPKKPGQWFMDYGHFIIRMAKIAEEQNCSMLIIGTELKSISGSEYQKYWEELIAEARRYYKGKITYAANWDEYQKVPFWDKLDFLGVDAYFPLSEEANPSLETLIKGWSGRNNGANKKNWLAELEAWHKKFKKPVVFTEIGYVSWDYAAYQPWNYSGKNPYNGELQARCYQAAINATVDKEWISGIFWWNWEPKPIVDGKNKCTLPPQGKPAMEVLKGWGVMKK